MIPGATLAFLAERKRRREAETDWLLQEGRKGLRKPLVLAAEAVGRLMVLEAAIVFI